MSRMYIYGLITAALGAGIFIGVTGILVLMSALKGKKKILSKGLDELELSLTESHKALRRNPVSFSSRLSLRSNSSRSSRIRRSGFESDDEMFSALGSECGDFYGLTSDDEEYFSCTSKSFQASRSYASDENLLNLFEEVDILLKGNDEDRANALMLLHQEENLYSENPNFLWRMAKACQMQATAFGAKNDMIKKKEFVYDGLDYAGRALAIDPFSPDAHKWYAILTGMQGEFVSLKEKIQSGYVFQKHIKEALKQKPNDYSLHHLLGRFKYEIANLSWFEKKVAASLFAELPDVTVQDALSDFKKAEELNRVPWKENRLFIAKCYIACRNYEEAWEWLNSTKELGPHTKEDEVCDEECESLLLRYKKYGIKTSNSF